MFCLADRSYSKNMGDMMEAVEIPCDKCGQSFPDNCTFVSHSCSKSHTSSPRTGKLNSYKCSQCNEGFSKTTAQKHHFKTNHGDLHLQGPFTCSEKNCQFSSADRLEYQAHLLSTHGLTVIPCTYRSCKASFLSQGEMESHRKSHSPFGCFHCDFVSESAKEFNGHLLEHSHLTSDCQGRTSKAACTSGGKPSQVSQRERRNSKFIPALDSSSLQGEPEEEHKREEVGKDDSPAADSTPLPSKEYLAEGSEHIYRTHTCPKCRRCFKMRSHLQEHLRLHFPDPSLQCPTCKRFFTSKSKLRLHRLREAGEKIHRCHLCDYSAVEKNAICRHLLSVHADGAEDALKSLTYVCPTCGQSFLQSRALKAHMKTHNILSDSKPLPCFQESCSFQSCLHKELIKHAAEVHGVTAAECRHHACGAIFQSEADMEVHYRTHLAYHCSECDFSCSNKTLFLQHRRHGHAGKEKLCCDFCVFVTFNPVEFEEHIGHLHANEKIHRCPQCSYVTSHKRGLKRHLLMHSGEKPHKCSVCEFRCRDESYLSRHMLTHSEDKNFMCAECGYVTKWKHYLNVHMRKHAGDLRYSCDQCPYRCHRVDQLNSHKLRHQAKTLMCEICAYACKRKYELRNHMLAKHSGEEKQPALYKCKYCTYATSYRQALQNHENCKHTKLKEFPCALCPYSSFSSISLFLHKRNVHGYIPGDKAWLENYAAKEKERNSTEFMQDFYMKPVVDGEQSEQSISADNQPEQSNVDAQKVMHEEFSDCPSVSSPEQYCTLVLTTVTATKDQTPPLLTEEKNSAGLSSLDHHGPDSSKKKTEISAPASSSEEDNVAVQDTECGESDMDDTCAPLIQTVQSHSQTSEVENDTESNSSAFLLEQNQPLQSEIRLKAMRKHDKDQAEAMVLEGRVQMLVVPTEDVYRCDKCSYVTSKETALKHHHQALCQSRIKGYECQACGVQFKQKRGLDGHLRKKCPALLRKTTCQVESKQVDGGTNSDPIELLSSQDEVSAVCSSQCKFKRHLPTCREVSGRKDKPMIGDERGNELVEATNKAAVEISNKIFSCPNCAFKCTQKRALDSHETRGCMKPGEVQCSSCLFIAKSKLSLTRHVLYVHKKGNLGVGKPKCLHCQLCAFSCKQQRCMDQHIALKHKGARPYQCRYCSFGTTRRYRLEEHESLHTGIGRHSCNECDKTFGSVTKLRQHKMRIHDKRPHHSCSLCDFSGYALDDVRRHERRCHTGRLRHVCTHCNAKFSSEIALRNHCKRVHQAQVCFSCKKCDYTCSSDVMLKAHQQSRHPQVKCTTCQESFETKESLEIHQRAHLAHQCQLCPFASKTRQLLAQHLLSEHEEGSPEGKPLKCSTCPFTCWHQLVLEQHLRSHGSKRLYKCTDCEYSTRNKQKITWHIRTHTGEKPYSCEQCSYACTDPSRLKLHMRVHQDEKKYLCPECGYKCKWATQLKYHMTKHTGEKPYACDDCSYRTNRADALRAHRDTQHSDLRPYVCEKCGKAFKTTFILKTHQRQHSDDRPYVCGSCHKAFRWPAGLRHHFLSHTKQQPFCCRHCSYRAKQKFQVVKHLQRHHPEASVEEGVLRDSEAGGLTLKVALQGTLDRVEDGSKKLQ